MSDSTPKPRLLMFLHGVMVLMIIWFGLAVLGSALMANRMIRYGGSLPGLLIQVFVALVSVILSFLTARAIGRRSRNAPVLGTTTFVVLGVWTLGSLTWYLISSRALSGNALLVYLVLMIAQIVLYVAGAAAFTFSPSVRAYFRPEEQPSDLPPPPPPDFTD